MNYEGMVEESIPIYYYRLGCMWYIGVLSRSIPDCDSLNIMEFDDYGRGI